MKENTFRCKKCDTEFPDAAHLSRHEDVHNKKSKITEYGDPIFTQDRLRISMILWDSRVYSSLYHPNFISGDKTEFNQV